MQYGEKQIYFVILSYKKDRSAKKKIKKNWGEQKVLDLLKVYGRWEIDKCEFRQ